MPHSLDEAFNNFERALDQQFSEMDLHDAVVLPPNALSRPPDTPLAVAGGFKLATPCSLLLDKSQSDDDGCPEPAVVHQHRSTPADHPPPLLTVAWLLILGRYSTEDLGGGWAWIFFTTVK